MALPAAAEAVAAATRARRRAAARAARPRPERGQPGQRRQQRREHGERGQFRAAPLVRAGPLGTGASRRGGDHRQRQAERPGADGGGGLPRAARDGQLAAPGQNRAQRGRIAHERRCRGGAEGGCAAHAGRPRPGFWRLVRLHPFRLCSSLSSHRRSLPSCRWEETGGSTGGSTHRRSKEQEEVFTSWPYAPSTDWRVGAGGVGLDLANSPRARAGYGVPPIALGRRAVVRTPKRPSEPLKRPSERLLRGRRSKV